MRGSCRFLALALAAWPIMAFAQMRPGPGIGPPRTPVRSPAAPPPGGTSVPQPAPTPPTPPPPPAPTPKPASPSNAAAGSTANNPSSSFLGQLPNGSSVQMGFSNPSVGTVMPATPDAGMDPGPAAPSARTAPVPPPSATDDPYPAIGPDGISQIQWNYFLWAHWWEWNRDEVLTPLISHKAQPALTKAPKTRDDPSLSAALDAHDSAIQALLWAAHHANPQVRIEATIALARSGDPAAAVRLTEMTKDPAEDVRYTAWLAIGLLHTPRSEQMLLATLSKPDVDRVDALGAIAGVGMLDKPSPNTIRALIALYPKASEPEIRRMILWCLRIHKASDAAPLARAVVHREKDPALAAEALLALGTLGNADDALPASHITDYLTQQTQEKGQRAGEPSSAGATLASQAKRDELQQQSAQTPGALRARRAALQKLADAVRTVPAIWAFNNPQASESPASLRATAQLLTAAVMSLGPMATRDSDAPAGSTSRNIPSRYDVERQSILRCFESALNAKSEPGTWQGPAMLAFAQADTSEDSLATLFDLLTYGPQEKQLGHSSANVWVRQGFAAMAIAMQDVQSRLAGQELRVSPPWAQAYSEMAAITRDKTVPCDVRAACALALGISGRPENLRLLTAAPTADGDKSPLGSDHLFVRAHVLLARAMLGDPTVVDDATTFLGKTAPQLQPQAVARRNPLSTHVRIDKGPALDDLTTRRAVLLALGLTGDPRALPAINAQWGENYWVTLEAARAMAWCGGTANVDPLIEILHDPAPSTRPELAARTLGELLDTERPSRLSRLLTGTCYPEPLRRTTQQFDWGPVPGMQPVCLSPANPFLYRFMKDRWDPTRSPAAAAQNYAHLGQADEIIARRTATAPD